MATDEKKPVRALARLCHHRWSVPALAALDDLGGGAKFVTLQRALDTNRDSLQRTLAALLEGGLAARNPGYGHPMRPEYLLTLPGKRLAPACRKLLDKLILLKIAERALNKWSLPVVHALATTEGRFNALLGAVPDITPRALTAALADLEAAGLITRTLVDERPPRADYALTKRGRDVLGLLAELARIVAALPDFARARST